MAADTTYILQTENRLIKAQDRRSSTASIAERLYSKTLSEKISVSVQISAGIVGGRSTLILLIAKLSMSITVYTAIKYSKRMVMQTESTVAMNAT